MITCKKCGRVLNQEDISCPVCGTPTVEPPSYFFSTQSFSEAPGEASGDSPREQPDTPPNVSYVTPPPQFGNAQLQFGNASMQYDNAPLQYGNAPPADVPPNYAPPQYGNAAPPNALPPNVPPLQYGYAQPQGYNNNNPAYNNSGIYAQKRKSKLAAGLLAILLGWGIYNFYLKYYAKAIIQLVGTLVSLGLVLYWVGQFMMMMGSMIQSTLMFDFNYEYYYTNFFTTELMIGSLLSMSIGLWQFVEGILILAGVIKKDGAGDPIA